MSWLNLANKTAIVTGAGSGIGAAVAQALSREKCHVVMVDTSFSNSSSSSTAGGEQQIQCNVANEQEVRQLFQSLDQKDASILVNCAGITRDGWIGKMSLSQFQQVMDVNLTGTFLCCREFLNQDLSNNNGGSIVNISSVVAKQGNLGQVNYAASKGGVLSLTRSLAKEVAYRKIRVNCVVPGFIETNMAQAVPENIQTSIRENKIAWKEFGKPEDVANLVTFLASCHRARYITGEAIECSGLISL